MFVATCMAGMVTMTTLNNHPEVIKIPTTRSATTLPTDNRNDNRNDKTDNDSTNQRDHVAFMYIYF